MNKSKENERPRCSRCGAIEDERVRNFRAERIAAGLTQKQLADRMGISATYLCHLENYGRQWHITLILKFDKALFMERA